MTVILIVGFPTRGRAVQAARALAGVASCGGPWRAEAGGHPWKLAVACLEGGKPYVIGEVWRFGGTMIEERTSEEGGVPTEDVPGAGVV